MNKQQTTRISVAASLAALLTAHATYCRRTTSQQTEMLLVILYGNQEELLPKYREAAATLRKALADITVFDNGMHERMAQMQAEIHARQQAAEGAR